MLRPTDNYPKPLENLVELSETPNLLESDTEEEDFHNKTQNTGIQEDGDLTLSSALSKFNRRREVQL